MFLSSQRPRGVQIAPTTLPAQFWLTFFHNALLPQCSSPPTTRAVQGESTTNHLIPHRDCATPRTHTSHPYHTTQPYNHTAPHTHALHPYHTPIPYHTMSYLHYAPISHHTTPIHHIITLVQHSTAKHSRAVEEVVRGVAEVHRVTHQA